MSTYFVIYKPKTNGNQYIATVEGMPDCLGKDIKSIQVSNVRVPGKGSEDSVVSVESPNGERVHFQFEDENSAVQWALEHLGWIW
jgi:hypothetical protein